MHLRDFGAALLVLALGGAAAAEETTTADDVKKLREEVERLRREVDEMKQSGAAAKPAPGETKAEGVKPEAGDTRTGGAKPAPAETEDEELRALREEAAAEAAGGKPAAATPAGGQQPAGGGEGTTFTQRLNQFNPRLTAFGDFAARLKLGDHPLRVEGEDPDHLPQVDDKIWLRGVELDLRADVDPYAKAVLILAVEKERPGLDYEIDAEEGYVTLETLPANFRGKIGRWREEFGIANNTHRHDLPWFDYPYPLFAFLGEEGLIGDGASLFWLAPGIPLELMATVLDSSGWFVSEEANEPDYLGRASYFIDLTARSWLRAGGSILYGKTTPGGGHDAILGGADLTFKWVESERASFVLTSEFYAIRRDRFVDDGMGGTVEVKDDAQGFFVAAQIQPWLQRWYFGGRYDWDDYFREIEGNREWALSAFVSYYTTEFLRFRVGYEHREMETGPTDRKNDSYDTLLFQVTWVFGSHPAEPYWVNR